MDRTKLLVFLLVILAIGGLACLLATKRVERSWVLPDGSELSLATVTFGRKHEVCYGNRWRDRLGPLLPEKLQSKLGCKVAVHTPANPEAIVLWFRRRNISPTSNWKYRIAALDGHGLEGVMLDDANDTYQTSPGGASLLQGWELLEYPRRSGELGIRIYASHSYENPGPVGEFKVKNRLHMNAQVWIAEPLPASRRTNDLEISLLQLETGLTFREAGVGSAAGENARAFSRATIRILERGKPSGDWWPSIISASAATGEIEPGGASGSLDGGTARIVFRNALWLEEPAWKLKVEISRRTNFSPEEIWTIRKVPVPLPGQVIETHVETNMYGADVEFLGVSAPGATLPQDWTRMQPHANLHIRTPLPLSDAHLTLVEVRDDQGRPINLRGFAELGSTGGRGATIKELHHGFAVEIPEDAKTLDITFAFSKSRFVEFLARPVMAQPSAATGVSVRAPD